MNGITTIFVPCMNATYYTRLGYATYTTLDITSASIDQVMLQCMHMTMPINNVQKSLM
jgi:hypothetical protein